LARQYELETERIGRGSHHGASATTAAQAAKTEVRASSSP
jgi:hypothetical protein